MFDKVVIVTKETQLDQLVRRFSSKPQAAFYIAQSQKAFRAKRSPAPMAASAEQLKREEEEIRASFKEIEVADSKYKSAIERVKAMLPAEIKLQHIDWSYLPNYLFGERDLVVTLGQDGLVINTAKYLSGQPVLAINPDPGRFDGVLIPFDMEGASKSIRRVVHGEFSTDSISIARASLDNGQELFGVNDIFIGPKSHISFRYSIQFEDGEEEQSSSGIIVSTGAGSTGWFRSIIEMARGISSSYDQQERGEDDSRFDWDSDFLYFSVREPFPSRTSGTDIIFGKITAESPLVITSMMPQNGVIFSDGIENDFLEFNSGRIATVSLADKKARLIRSD